MNENPAPSAPTPATPAPDELRIKQYQDEIASRERLTTAAEYELKRVWDLFDKILKYGGVAVSIILVIVAALCTFFGIKTHREILNDAMQVAQSAAESEVSNVRTQVEAQIGIQLSTPSLQKLIADQIAVQLSSPQIQKIFTDKIDARLDVASTPIITSFLSNNAEAWTQNYLANYRTENYSGTNSDRITLLKFSDGAAQIFIRLNYDPALNSVHVIQAVSGVQVPVDFVNVQLNVLNIYFTPGAAAYLDKSTFNISYSSAKSQPYIVQRVEIRGKTVWFDNTQIKYPQNGD